MNITEVCYLESKLRTNGASTAGKDALQQLREDLTNMIPIMLEFIVERLSELGDPLYGSLLDFILNRARLTNLESLRITIICEKDKWTEKCLENLGLSFRANETRPLTVATNLDQFVCDVFTPLGINVDLVDD